MTLRILTGFRNKKRLLQLIRTMENSFFGSVFEVSDIYDIKLFTRLSPCLSNLYENKFRYSFNDTINLMGNTLFA